MDYTDFFQTEQDVEVWAEHVADRIDSKYMNDQLTTEQYNLETNALYEQVREIYKRLAPQLKVPNPVDFFKI
jgi:hypothetical protein